MSPFYNRIRSYIKGSYRIAACGQDMKRLWNMCAFHGVDLWNLTAEEACYRFSVGKREYALFEELLNKTDVVKSEVTECGLPYLLKRIKSHLTFFLGMGTAMALILLLSQFVWSIQISGNSGYDTKEFMRFLSEQEVEHGMWKKKIVCSRLAASMRERFPNITWVSAKIHGTRLLIEVKENILPEEEKQKEESPQTPSHLVAEKDGVIVRMITRSGTPLVSPGTVCKKGDVLVEGIVPIYNDSQEIVRYDCVSADADIEMQTGYMYYDEFELKYEKQTWRESKKMPFIQVGAYRIGEDYEEKLPKDLRKIRHTEQLFLTRTFGLPVYYGETETRFYDITNGFYTKSEAEELADARFSVFLGNLKKKGVQLCENSVKIEMYETKCITKGSITVIEKTGKSRPFQPEEFPVNEIQEE